MDPPTITSPVSFQSALLNQSTQSSGPPSSLIIPISRTEIFPLPSPRTNNILTTNNKTGSKAGEADGSAGLTGGENGRVLTLAEQQELVSFPLLPGEGMVDSCGLLDSGRLILTNYRLYIQLGEGEEYHVPLGLIESIEVKDLFYLGMGCKDARSYRCTFDNNEQCLQWFGTLLKASEPPRQLQELFAFSYYAWSKENTIDDFTVRLEDGRPPVYDEAAFMKEVQRLQFGSVWRISSANEEYKMCSSYPPKLLVPSNIQDDKLEAVAKFRSSRRIPAVVWRHVGNGAVIARCSQPEVGWLGWRSSDDEDLVKEILHACAMDAMPATALDTYSHSPALSSDEDAGGPFAGYPIKGVVENGLAAANGEKDPDDRQLLGQTNGVAAKNHTDLKVNTEKKVLIMDARSYTTAVANRARGGGCECPEYYPSCEIQFMNLANIHSIRKSFHALRQLCTSAADQPNWFSLLEGTRWLLHQSGLMRAAVTLITAIERDARPVLVHCSDGWDRTPQIVALAQLLLDPYYRTIDGFRILIEREWLAFGHKFADRCGHTTGSEDQNERCPVFLQWLDCVHQLLEQFPCSFEFSDTYLVKLVQHTYSNLFGTFLCNTKKDRDKELFNTFTVWTFLDSSQFRNYLYKPAPPGVQVLWPQCNVRDLKLWSAVYLGSLESNKHDNTVQSQQTDNISLNQDTAVTTTVSKPPINTNNKRTTPTTSVPTLPPTVLIAKPTTVTQHQQNSVKSSKSKNMTKTRSYGDLLQMGSTLTTCSKQCNNANNGLQARVGVGGTCVTDGPDATGKEKNVRRLSDPSSVDIKILNLAMAEHSEPNNQPHSSSSSVAAFPTTAHTYITNNQPQSSENTSESSQLLQNGTTNATAAPPPPSSSTDCSSTTSTTDDIDSSNCGIDIVIGSCQKQEKQILLLDEEGDINHNDSCDDLTQCCEFVEPLLPAVVSSLKDSCERLLNSVETSTETLVAENGTTRRMSPLNTTVQPTPTNNHHDVTDSGRSLNCRNQSVNVFNKKQCQPTASVSASKLTTCSVCAQNKRFVTETQTQFNHNPLTDESVNNATSNSSRTIAQLSGAGQQQSNGQCCVDGANFTLNGYGSSNVTSGINTPTSLMTDDSVTAAITGINRMDSPGVLNGMTTSGYWGVPSAKMAPNMAASLGDDGLVPLRSEMQERVATLIEENRREVEGLKLELQKYRYALLQQLCHRCHHNDSDKYDDAQSTHQQHNTSPTALNHPSTSCHCPSSGAHSAAHQSHSMHPTTAGGNTIGLFGGNPGAGESGGTVASSLRSDHSWDSVEDVLVLEQQVGNPTLWMPDHAVSRCADCRCEFWIGRRRHHCRKCGQIFCAECSEHYAPIPTEHLYTPVRVCRSCFTTLRQSNTELHDEDDLDQRVEGDAANLGSELDGLNATSTAFSQSFTPRNVSAHAHKAAAAQPVQCCHHQHQQQSAGSSTVVGGCAVTSSGAGGSNQIAASSN